MIYYRHGAELRQWESRLAVRVWSPPYEISSRSVHADHDFATAAGGHAASDGCGDVPDQLRVGLAQSVAPTNVTCRTVVIQVRFTFGPL